MHLPAHSYAGVLLGLSNTAGVLAGVMGSLVTGYILQHGDWKQVWGGRGGGACACVCTSVVSVCACACVCVCASVSACA